MRIWFMHDNHTLTQYEDLIARDSVLIWASRLFAGDGCGMLFVHEGPDTITVSSLTLHGYRLAKVDKHRWHYGVTAEELSDWWDKFEEYRSFIRLVS